MRIENENEYYISKLAIIDSGLDFNNTAINETIQFSFIDELCYALIGENKLLISTDTLMVNDEISSNINIIPKKETQLTCIFFHKKHFIQTVSKYLDYFQDELNQIENTTEDQLDNDYHIFENTSKLQKLLSDLLKTSAAASTAINKKLAQLKMETFIIEALQTDLIGVFKSLIGNNYSTDPISYTLKLIADTPKKNWSIKELAYCPEKCV